MFDGCHDIQDRMAIADVVEGARLMVNRVLDARWARQVTGKLHYFDHLELDRRYFGTGNEST